MSDDAATHFEKQEEPAPQAPQKSFTMTITAHPDGSLDMIGPLNNKVLSMGILAAAQAQLTEMWTKRNLVAEATKAQASRGGIAGIMKRMNGG